MSFQFDNNINVEHTTKHSNPTHAYKMLCYLVQSTHDCLVSEDCHPINISYIMKIKNVKSDITDTSTKTQTLDLANISARTEITDGHPGEVSDVISLIDCPVTLNITYHTMQNNIRASEHPKNMIASALQ